MSNTICKLYAYSVNGYWKNNFDGIKIKIHFKSNLSNFDKVKNRFCKTLEAVMIYMWYLYYLKSSWKLVMKTSDLTRWKSIYVFFFLGIHHKEIRKYSKSIYFLINSSLYKCKKKKKSQVCISQKITMLSVTKGNRYAINICRKNKRIKMHLSS